MAHTLIINNTWHHALRAKMNNMINYTLNPNLQTKHKPSIYPSSQAAAHLLATSSGKRVRQSFSSLSKV
jgi:hypothetical protein